jgi:Holliday junction DNA helicase RuvB
LRLDFYSNESLKKIVTDLSSRLGISIDEKGALEIAKRGRGTPRIVTRILRRVRDFAEIKGDGIITYDIARNALDLLDIDEVGLDELDRRILKTIIQNYSGGPVGLDTLAVAVGEERDNIYEVCEPFLIKKGFLIRTPKGRIATKIAYNHMGFEYPTEEEND